MATEIDIAVTTTTYDVTIVAEPNEYIVNITTGGGGGGNQTLAQTLDLGNTTGGENIVINNADAIELENTSLLKKGTYDFGGNGGISRICSNQYEDMWQNGFRHVFDQSGFIRNSSNGFDLVPDSSFDVTLRFKVGSFWTLDNGTTYICTDATEGAAEWEIYSVAGIPTLQEVTDEGATTTNDITISKETGTSFIQVANNDNTLTLQVESVNGSLIELNDTNNNNYGSLSCGELLMTSGNSSENIQLNSNYLSIQSASVKPLIELNGTDGTLTGSVQIKTDLIDGNYTQQLPDKSGTFAMLDDVTGVPYTGATEDLNLGEFGLLTGNIEFDNTPTNIPTGAGSMVWNDTDGTVDLKLKGGNVTLQVGQENVIRVVNKTATNINLLEANYQAVRVTGAQGQRLKVDLAQATTDALSAETIGLVTETINNNQEGFITTSGLIRNVNTTGSLQSETWADGDILYLSPTTAGQVTKVKPTAPNHLVIIGYVVSAHATQGSIFVKVDNGYELNELHNVNITSETNNQLLAYTSATDIWENKNIIDLIVDSNRTKAIIFFDDFLGTNDNAGINTSTGVVMSATGIGSASRITGVYPNRINQQGVIQLATGTTASGAGIFRLGSTNTPTFFVGSGAISYEVLINIETLSTLANRFVNIFGLYTGGSLVSSNNLIGFIYDEGGVFASGGIGASPNWKCVTGNAGTRTSTDSTIAVTASAWTKLRIEINANATSVGFYINDTLVATNASNIPATTTAMYFLNAMQKTTGLTSVNMYADYLSFKQTFTTAR